MKLFGYAIIKESSLDSFFKEFYVKHADAEGRYKDGYDDGYEDGVNHVFEKIKEAIKQKNINRVLTISHATSDDLKMLVDGLLGKFVRKSS